MKSSKQNKQKILIIRNDRLGDFMLAWPALALLRENLPKAHIAVLVPAYTQPLAEACEYVDEVIVDPKLKGDWKNGQALAALLSPKKFDVVITLFSRFDTGLAVWKAGIPERYAPATKLAQFFYNHRVTQRRSRSEKPEYEYNQDLVLAFLTAQGVKKPKSVEAPYLSFKPADAKKVKQKFLKSNRIAATKKLVFVHAGHGGSANNLSVLQYAELIKFLSSSKQRHFVLTAGPGKKARSIVSHACSGRSPMRCISPRMGWDNSRSTCSSRKCSSAAPPGRCIWPRRSAAPRLRSIRGAVLPRPCAGRR